MTLYGLSVAQWVAIIEITTPVLILLAILFLRYRRNQNVRKFIEQVFPFLKNFEPVKFRDRVDSAPQVEFARAKNKFTIVFTRKFIVPDLQPFLNLLTDGVLYSKEENFYVFCLDLSNVISIDDNGIIAVTNVMTRILQYNGICLDIILPEQGDKINILASKLFKIRDSNRHDIRILTNINSERRK